MAEAVGLGQDQVRVKEEYGGGYVANVEGLHHLHCLVCVYPVPDDELLICACPELASSSTGLEL